MDFWSRYKHFMTKSLPYPEFWIAAAMVFALLVTAFVVESRPIHQQIESVDD